MQKEPKLPDDSQNPQAQPTIPVGSSPRAGASEGESPDQQPRPEGRTAPHASDRETPLTSPGGCPMGAAADPRMMSPVGWNPYPMGGMAEEEEINLLDLFIVLLKHKWMIFWVVFLAGVAAVVISLLMPNVYLSEATIAPTEQEKVGGGLSALGGFGAMIAAEVGIGATGSLDQFDVVLKSRELTGSIIRGHNLLPVIFDESWDAKAGKWKVEDPSLLERAAAALKNALQAISGTTPDGKDNLSKFPTLQDAYEPIQEMLSLKPDKKKNVMSIGFESKDPEMARKILDYYIVGLSEFLRRQTLEDAAAQQVHLAQQLSKTTDPLLKNRLYELIAKQIEKETLAKIQRYYSFNVIDPSFVPEKKFKPKRALICLLSVVVAFFIAVFLAFFLEYLKNLKTSEDPERLASFRKSLRL